MQKAITYPDTKTETVKIIFDTLGVDLHVIHDLKDFKTVGAFDGLILLGGADINPFWYGENNQHASNIDSNRDRIEWIMLRQAMSMNVPIFGICRGHQFISVAHGASLYQDIYRQEATFIHGNQHKISVKDPLGKHIPSNQVNSYHHQAIRNAPDGFKVLATSDDDIIEAIWKPGVLGVQFHPEMMFTQDHRWIGLFKWFTNGLR